MKDTETTYEPVSSAEDVGVTEHVPATITQKSLNSDLLRLLGRPGWLWWAVFLFDLAVLAVGMVALRNEIVLGIGVAGHTRPVMWASYVTNFVFWVGIAHCGTLVSAILFLFGLLSEQIAVLLRWDLEPGLRLIDLGLYRLGGLPNSSVLPMPARPSTEACRLSRVSVLSSASSAPSSPERPTNDSEGLRGAPYATGRTGGDVGGGRVSADVGPSRSSSLTSPTKR